MSGSTGRQTAPESIARYKNTVDPDFGPKVVLPDDIWRTLLSEHEYAVTRMKATEPAFSGIYNDSDDIGIYECVCCGNDLFNSDTKFHSGSGWPSFYAPLSEQSIRKAPELRLGMIKTEVLCSRCAAHLGHVFNDGPPPTGLRYCINSAALNFVPGGK